MTQHFAVLVCFAARSWWLYRLKKQQSAAFFSLTSSCYVHLWSVLIVSCILFTLFSCTCSKWFYLLVPLLRLPAFTEASPSNLGVPLGSMDSKAYSMRSKKCSKWSISKERQGWICDLLNLENLLLHHVPTMIVINIHHIFLQFRMVNVYNEIKVPK